MKTKTLSVSETSYLLRKKLGAIRVWPHFLTDNRRDRQDVGGLTLSPCVKVRGRSTRPFYDVRDVIKFIMDVKALGLASSRPEEIETFEVDLDPEIPWFVRVVDTDGKPVTKH